MTEGKAKTAALADTNLFIALFAGPEHRLHEEAIALFRRVADGELALTVTSLVVSELVYAAGPILGWSRAETSSKLSLLLEADGLTVPEQAILQGALELYGKRRQLDFADAYLASVVLARPAAVASFDTDYDSIEGVTRISA